MKKISPISLMFIMPLILLFILVYQFKYFPPADVSAAPGEASGFELRWTDDFESYTASGTFTEGFPFSNYTHSGLKDMFVYTDTYVSPSQSLKGHGLSGEFGGSVAYRSIEGGSPVEVEIWIRNGTTPMPLLCCHYFYGGLELSTDPFWQGDHRGLIAFTYDEDDDGNMLHQIYGGALEVDEPYPGEERLYLGDYEVGTWYKVKVRYEVIDDENVQLTYWIDDQEVGQQQLGIRPFESQFRYIGLFVGQKVAWFDDVSLYSGDSTLDLGITKEANADVVAPGAEVIYELQITNHGPISVATGVEVIDTLPAGMVYQSATPSQGSCQESGGTITCSLGVMAVDDVSTIEIVAIAPQSTGVFTNVATVSSDLPDIFTDNNTAQATVTLAHLQLLPMVLKEP